MRENNFFFFPRFSISRIANVAFEVVSNFSSRVERTRLYTWRKEIPRVEYIIVDVRILLAPSDRSVSNMRARFYCYIFPLLF